MYDALIGTAGKQVILRVNSKPTDAGAHDVTVVPTDDEAPLYYIDWVQKNIDYVNKKTGGEVGYLHIPDMSQAGLNEFTKLYFPQIRKHALIVDVRGNGGGFVSPLVIERLRRVLQEPIYRVALTPLESPLQVVRVVVPLLENLKETRVRLGRRLKTSIDAFGAQAA